MSISSELRNKAENDNSDCILDVEDMERCLQGNLCRCTGYRPILESFDGFCKGHADVKQNIRLSKEADPKTPEEILDGKLGQDFLHFVDANVSRLDN